MNLIKLKKIIPVLLLAVIAVLPLLNCGSKPKVEPEKSDPFALDTVPVKVINVHRGEIKLTKTFTGTLEGESQANIVAKISERITAINVKVGDAVKAGEVMLTLDKSGVTSQYYQAQAGFLNAEKDIKRMKELYEAGAVSRQMLDGTNTSFVIAKANFEAAQAAVILTAPISGIVTAVNSNIGDLAVPGIPLVTIADIRNMKIIFSVGEGDLSNFTVGQAANIYSEQNHDLIKTGTIFQIAKSADVQSRSFDLKALFQNTNNMWFKPGMFCRVNVDLQNHSNIFSVPNAALINSQNSTALFIIADGKANLRQVKTGITDGKFTEITEGLKEGEKVVTLGTNNLKHGSIVHITD